MSEVKLVKQFNSLSDSAYQHTQMMHLGWPAAMQTKCCREQVVKCYC